jgi:hypothetical protein
VTAAIAHALLAAIAAQGAGGRAGTESCRPHEAGVRIRFPEVGIRAAELRALRAPTRDRYKREPEAASITLKARGALEDQNIACKVETDRIYGSSRVTLADKIPSRVAETPTGGGSVQ